MTKFAYLIVITTFLSFYAKAQSGWVKQNISPMFSVKFPSAPQKATNSQIDYYIVEGKDSCRYVAMLADFKVSFGMDSVTLAVVKDTPKFAWDLAAGMTTSMKEFALSPVIQGKWNGYSSYAFAGVTASGKSKLQMFIVLIGTKVYTLSCTISGSSTAKNKEAFFGSATLEK